MYDASVAPISGISVVSMFILLLVRGPSSAEVKNAWTYTSFLHTSAWQGTQLYHTIRDHR
jgi:hypothetical protein